MSKVESRTHEVSLHNLAAERHYPWDLQIVERTLTTNDRVIVKNVTTVSQIRFQTYSEVVKFANDLKAAVTERSLVGRFEDRRKFNLPISKAKDRRK